MATVEWFQPTPRFVNEGNIVNAMDDEIIRLFQPTPRFVNEGNPRAWGIRPLPMVSTPPSLRQRGEHSACRSRMDAAWFQPTPRFVNEGNVGRGHRPGRPRRVSTHPSLRQ